MLISANEVLIPEVSQLVDYASLGDLSAVLLDGKSLGPSTQGIDKQFAPGLGRFCRFYFSQEDIADMPSLGLNFSTAVFGRRDYTGPRPNDEIEDTDGVLWRVRQWEALRYTGLYAVWASTDERGVRP